jgi:hypothetical protein
MRQIIRNLARHCIELFSSSSTLVVASRILLVLIAAGAVATGFLVSSSGGEAPDEERVSYVCPMHPDVSASSL